MLWRFKRQIVYIIFIVLFFFIVVFLFYYFTFQKKPTCFDRIKNGDESAADCGGSCLKVCSFQADNVSILWSRSFKVVPGRYNAVAYLENHNKNIAVNKISYRFRFADKNNVYIGQREGQTFIPISGKFAIFEPGIETGNSEPVFTTFEFTEPPVWFRVNSKEAQQIKILTSDIVLENKDNASRLSATVKNNSLFRIPNVNFIALLRDSNGNVINVSSTYLSLLKEEENRRINFTWPQTFNEEVIIKEVIPVFNIFSIEFKKN